MMVNIITALQQLQKDGMINQEQYKGFCLRMLSSKAETIQVAEEVLFLSCLNRVRVERCEAEGSISTF